MPIRSISPQWPSRWRRHGLANPGRKLIAATRSAAVATWEYQRKRRPRGRQTRQPPDRRWGRTQPHRRLRPRRRRRPGFLSKRSRGSGRATAPWPFSAGMPQGRLCETRRHVGRDRGGLSRAPDEATTRARRQPGNVDERVAEPEPEPGNPWELRPVEPAGCSTRSVVGSFGRIRFKLDGLPPCRVLEPLRRHGIGDGTCLLFGRNRERAVAIDTNDRVVADGTAASRAFHEEKFDGPQRGEQGRFRRRTWRGPADMRRRRT
jgi:hypothetical protein